MANFVEKENPMLRVAKYLIPWKGDKPLEMVRKIIFLAALIVLVVSLVSLGITANNKVKDTKDNNDLSNLYHGTGTGSTTVEIDTTKREELQREHPQVMDEFLPLLEINEDVVGWITIGDEDDPFIDYVVMQGDDNSYYLNHNYKGDKSVSGAIFADYRDPITADDQPANIVLYGHNMSSGEYFARLTRYFNYRPSGNTGMEFYKQHPTLTFSTLYEKSTYKIFAGVLMNVRKKDGEVFRYIDGLNFGTKAEFDDYCANILDRSTFYSPDVDLKYGDELLTLSTCIFDYGDAFDLRWVVFARKVRDGEDPTVDVERAYANPDPLYFEKYYRYYGGSWGGRQWPADLIQGYTY